MRDPLAIATASQAAAAAPSLVSTRVAAKPHVPIDQRAHTDADGVGIDYLLDLPFSGEHEFSR